MAIRDRRIGAPAGEQDRNQGKVIFFFLYHSDDAWVGEKERVKDFAQCPCHPVHSEGQGACACWAV